MKLTVIIPAKKNGELDILDSLRNQQEMPFQVIVIRGSNPSKNRNRGIARARGDFVAFTNAHSSFPNDWTLQIRNIFENCPNIDMIGGPQLTPKSNTGFGNISGYAFSSLFGAWKLRKRYSPAKTMLDVDETVLTSANLICKKKVVDIVKFDEGIYPGEDPKFISDVKVAGFRIGYFPKIISYNKRRATVRGLIKQIFNYGKVRPQKESFFTTLKNPFFFGPSLFLLYLLFLVGLISISPSITGNVVGGFETGLSWLFLPLAFYILLALLFSLIDSAKNKDLKAIFILPFIYPMIHLSYGVGMVWGYLKKLK